jgi:hypothetical protein
MVQTWSPIASWIRRIMGLSGLDEAVAGGHSFQVLYLD